MPFIPSILLLLAIFGTGFGFGYKVNYDALLKLQTEVSYQQHQAENILNAAVEEVSASEAKAVTRNKELEIANESAINTINTYDAQLDRLLAERRRTNRTSTMQASNSAQYIAYQARRIAYTEGLIELFKDRANAADRVSLYAAQCHQFVVRDNCGI